MVFPSLPVYLDPPNWQQQHNHQQAGHSENPQLLPPISPSSTGNARSIRPTSMAERARMAKIPQPETPLKCPRCESTNTKFCYFNNYSLSQPRHFCKTCRRYWTRGGALRNVPVGGGFRRNKRSKVSTKSQSSTDPQQGSITSPGPISSSNSCSTDMINSISILQNNHLPFIGSHRHNPSDYIPSELGLNFTGIHPSNFSISGNACSHNGIISSGVSFDQWRMPQGQQFPLLTGLDPHTSLYPFENEGVEPSFGEGISHNLTTKAGLASGITQFAPVKMEDHQGMSLSRQLLGVHGNENYWGGNTWTDIPGYNSTSTSNFL